MGEQSSYGVESFYDGGGSSWEPDPNGPFVGYRLNPAQIGFSTNPTSADQLGETLRGIRAGAKVIEVNLLRIGQGESDQQVPKQHFEEIRALSKLTGVKPSVHGPLIDAAGFSERGGQWSEENRQENERIMFAAMEKASWADPDKNIPVIFHSSNMLGAGTHYAPGDTKKGEERFKEEIVPVFNKETKQLTQVNETTKYRIGAPDDKFKHVQKIDDNIVSQNATTWDNELKSLVLEKKYADEALKEVFTQAGNNSMAREISRAKGEDPYRGFETDEEKMAYDQQILEGLTKARTLLDNNRQSFNSMFSQAYKHGTPEQQQALKKMSDEYGKEVKRMQDEVSQRKVDNIAKNELILQGYSKLQDKYLGVMEQVTGDELAPQVYVRGETFAMEEAAKTFGNVATKSYMELGGDKAPVVSVENVWNGAMFSRGKDMKELIEKSRAVMTENLVKEGMDKDEAKRIASKKIGMNFDVGHLNMFRKKGFETKDIVGEVKEFAPYINHMHLTDNFGFSDEHLYPGQGNVPFKELFTELSKRHPDIDSFKKIVETGGYEFRNLKGQSAHAFNLAAFGVPIFGGSYGQSTGAPTFDHALNNFGVYSSGYGTVNPEIHHSFYGAGFSNLPPEVGGVVPGVGGGTGRSRFGGAPMA